MSIRKKYAVWTVLQYSLHQSFIYSLTDFEDDSYIISISSKLYAKYYLTVKKNKYLNESEKTEIYKELLFEQIRMANPTLLSYEYYGFKNRERRDENLLIGVISTPITDFILELFEQKDDENLKRFLRMNIGDKTWAVVKFMTLVSIFNLAEMGYKPRYYHDLNLDKTWTTNWFELNFQKVHLEEWALDYSHKKVMEIYNQSSDSDMVSNKFYWIHRNTMFSSKLMNSFISIYCHIVLDYNVDFSMLKNDYSINIRNHDIELFNELFGFS